MFRHQISAPVAEVFMTRIFGDQLPDMLTPEQAALVGEMVERRLLSPAQATNEELRVLRSLGAQTAWAPV